MVLPTTFTSTGFPAVEATCETIGIRFDPWQADLNRYILAKDQSGQYAADTVVLSIPRQVGKTFDVGALVFADCIINPRTTTVWTAHRFKVSRETFDQLRALATSPLLAAHIDPEAITTGAGNESIKFRNGSRILFAARERGAVRGFANVRRLILDEAQILTEAALADVVPTMNQASNPQIILMGTPPKPFDPSEVFTNLRREALAGESTGVLYVEFSAPQGSDPNDTEALRQANPSYPRRTPMKAVDRMRKLLAPADFLREGLGIWDEDEKHTSVFAPELWASLAVDSPPMAAPVAYGLDMSPHRVVSIAACVPNDDERRLHLEIAATDEVMSTDGVVEWLASRAGRGIPVVVDAQSPAATMVEDLQAARVKVIVTTARDMGKACGGLYDAVTEGQISHFDQAVLNAAVAGAKRRKIGDAGLWGWDRKDFDADISALVAITLARFGAATTQRRQRTGQAVFR